MKLAWVTDPHLNFIRKRDVRSFYADLAEHPCDAVVITGDIAEAGSIASTLIQMSDRVSKPIYFVLGNHDYYGNSVEATREAMRRLAIDYPRLIWLTDRGVVQLNDDAVMVGVDGWADGRLGNYDHSSITLNDSVLITDLSEASMLSRESLLTKMQELADADANQLKSYLLEAVEVRPKKIVVLTHVPPFKEACWYKGRVSGDDGLPFFASKATGDVLLEMAEAYPSIEFDIFCGHTHHLANCHPLNNLSVRTGRAEYGHPVVQYTINVAPESLNRPSLFNRLRTVARSRISSPSTGYQK